MCTHHVIVCNKQNRANFESEDTNHAVGRDKPVLKVDARVGLERSKAFRKLGVEHVPRQNAFATFGLDIQRPQVKTEHNIALSRSLRIASAHLKLGHHIVGTIGEGRILCTECTTGELTRNDRMNLRTNPWADENVQRVL
jgi:hypothetical protein